MAVALPSAQSLGELTVLHMPIAGFGDSKGERKRRESKKREKLKGEGKGGGVVLRIYTSIFFAISILYFPY